MNVERPLSANVDAEQAVLTAILLDNTTLAEAVEFLLDQQKIGLRGGSSEISS